MWRFIFLIFILVSFILTTTPYMVADAGVTVKNPAIVVKDHINSITTLHSTTFPSNQKTSTLTPKMGSSNGSVSPPLLYLSTDPDNLWDPQTGIYVNYDNSGDEWERPVHVVFYDETGKLAFELDAGIRIHGTSSRTYPKKSFRLYFRSEYGQNWLNYPVFPNYQIKKFKRLVIHSSAQDQMFYPGRWILFKNALISTVSQNTNALATANRACAVYLNGEFWGMYHLLERIDDNFIESHFGYTDMDLLKGNTTVNLDVEEGTINHWLDTYNFFNSHHFINSDNYAHALDLIDCDNFIDYTIIETWSGNHDWPHNNFYIVRPLSGDDRWRWFIWDSDHSFANNIHEDVTLNSIAWITRDHPMPELKLFGSTDAQKYMWGTLMLRRLLENNTFKIKFLNRFADVLNTSLRPDRVVPKVDSLAANLSDNIPFELSRWRSQAHADASMNWEQNVAFTRDYVRRRPDILRRYIVDHFDLSGLFNLTIDDPEGEGTIQINTIRPSELPWQGVYFRNIPIILTAIPATGKKFLKWSDPTLPETEVVTISPNKDYAVHPVFVTEEKNVTVQYDFPTEGWYLVSIPVLLQNYSVNEIFPQTMNGMAYEWNSELKMYTPLSELEPWKGYWIAMAAPAVDQIDGLSTTSYTKHFLPGWHLIGSVYGGFEFIEPNDDPDGAVATPCYSWSESSLDYYPKTIISETEAIWIMVMDTCDLTIGEGSRGIVSALAKSNMNEFPARFGKNPPLPPALNWHSTSNSNIVLPEFVLQKNYPDPFNSSTTITFGLSKACHVEIVIYDLLGQVVKTLNTQDLGAGYYTSIWSGDNNRGQPVSTGLYWCKMQADDFTAIKKMVLIR